MTLTHLDLDRIEGLAGRLREKHFLDDESKARLPEPAADLIYLLRLERSEAADALTALIAYIRELEGALQNVASTYAAEDYRDGSQERRLGDLARTALQRKTP